MPIVQPLPESEATDKVEQTYGRIKESFGAGSVPEPFLVYARVPAFLQDFFMNYRKFVIGEGKLDLQTKAIIGLATAAAQRSKVWTNLMAARVKELGGSDQTIADAIGVAGACAMYNVFFKFRDIAGTDVFSGMSVGLRAHTFAGTSLDEKTVELINIAVSDINGCKPCTTGHVQKARELNVPDEAIQEAIQCAATISAGAMFLNAAGY